MTRGLERDVMGHSRGHLWRACLDGAGEHDGQMSGGGYESWFVSACDPVSARALWIRHTRHRPAQGRESAALWCTVIDPDLSQPPAVVKQVFAAFPPDAASGPGQFRGQAVLGEQTARWDLDISGGQPPLRPLLPPVLYRAPLPRTKLEVPVPDGQVTGVLGSPVMADGAPPPRHAQVAAIDA